jgi:hypothetical protein
MGSPVIPGFSVFSVLQESTVGELGAFPPGNA